MATDVERLVVLLEANAENLRRQMRGAERVVDNSSRRMERRLTNLRNAFYAIGAVLASGGLIGSTVRLADAYRGLDNRLRLVTDTEADRAELLRDLLDLSNETRTSLDATTTVFFRLSRGLERYGIQGERLLDILRTINQTVATSGATAAEAQGALIQFSQALNTDFQSAGQEIRSLQEGMPALVNAIEDGMDIARGSFVQMARDGEISTIRVIEALERIAGSVDEQFGQTNSTVGQAFQNLNDAVLAAVGNFDQAAGASDGFARSIDGLADTINDNLDTFQRLGDQIGNLLPDMAGATASALVRLRNGNFSGDPYDYSGMGGGGGGGGGWGAQGGYADLYRQISRSLPGGPSVGPQMVDEAERYAEALRRQEEASQALKDAANERLEIERKLADVAETIADKQREAQEELQRSMQRTVDGFINAIQTAESFEDALKNIVLQMIRMALLSDTGQSFLQSAFNAVAGAVLGGGSLPGRARGGHVAGGKAYMVGERRPEIFVPPAGGGHINPNARMGGSTSISFNVDARGAQVGVAEQIQAMFPGMVRQIKAEIRNDASRGGAFAGALGRA